MDSKPLSAKADSFSLPGPTRGGREVWPVYSGPAGNVASSDGISGSGESAGYTGEKGLRRTVMFINSATLRASLRSMPRVNQCHHHTGELSLILDKLAKLIESPGVVLSPLAPANRNSGADASQIFEGNTASSVFGLRNNTLGNAVVDVRSKPSFLAGTLNEQSLSSLRIFGLKLTPELGMALAQPVDLSAGVNSTIGVGSNIHDAEVDSQELSRVAERKFFNLAGLEKVKGAIPVNQVGLAKKMLKKLRLAWPSNKRDDQPSLGSPDGHGTGGYLPGKDAFVIGNAAAPVEGALDGTSGLVSIGNLRQHPDHDLRRQIEAAAQFVIKQMVKVILAEGLRLPGPFTDIVGGIIHRLQCIQQGIVLLWSGRQLNLRNQFHSLIIPQYSTLDKMGGSGGFLCQLKQAVSTAHVL